jgi:hypothetical protein
LETGSVSRYARPFQQSDVHLAIVSLLAWELEWYVLEPTFVGISACMTRSDAVEFSLSDFVSPFFSSDEGRYIFTGRLLSTEPGGFSSFCCTALKRLKSSVVLIF